MTGNIQICNTISPCKGCASREVGCHSACEKYAEFRSGRQEVYKKRTESRKYANAIIDVRAKGGT